MKRFKVSLKSTSLSTLPPPTKSIASGLTVLYPDGSDAEALVEWVADGPRSRSWISNNRKHHHRPWAFRPPGAHMDQLHHAALLADEVVA
jgi:hypothetical protein